jgi:Chlorite dismutase
MRPLPVTFVGGEIGSWAVEGLETVAGAPLEPASRLEVIEGEAATLSNGKPAWLLRGVTSNERYVSQIEHDALAGRQESLGRPALTRAALIPIRKSDIWWELPQDERRRIFEESSHHVATGLEYLPAVARRLHHGRDLGEPFDFLTWFEFAPEHAETFDELVGRLRETEEWSYVEREIDIRLASDPKNERSREILSSAAPRDQD